LRACDALAPDLASQAAMKVPRSCGEERIIGLPASVKNSVWLSPPAEKVFFGQRNSLIASFAFWAPDFTLPMIFLAKAMTLSITMSMTLLIGAVIFSSTSFTALPTPPRPMKLATMEITTGSARDSASRRRCTTSATSGAS